MSLFSFLTGGSVDGLTFDWNGTTIRFSDWADDAYGVYHYQSRCRRYDFTFDLRRVGDEVVIYILKQPGYGHRPDDGHATHRLGLERGRPYVCVKHSLRPRTVPEALSWATYWAEETARYIKTGRSFS
jgi:hypothetical protein